MIAASAAELVANPRLDIDPVTAFTSKGHSGYTDDELKHFRIGHDDIDELVLIIYGFGHKSEKVKKNVRRFVTDAVFEDSIDQTPTFTLNIHDPDWELLNTGALEHTIDLNPGRIRNRWYQITSFDVSDDDITLTFQTRNAVYLSRHRRPHKANRKRVTRAQFILSLVREVKKTRIRFYCPQLNKKQKVAKTKFPSETERKNAREKGFSDSDKITVKHGPANKHQRNTIEKVIAAGLDVNAPDLVIVSAIMCIIQESEAGKNTKNPDYVGTFQQRGSDGWPATGDAYKDAKGNGKLGVKQGGYYGMAIPQYKKHPNQDLGMLVATVQGVVGSTNPLNAGYAQSTNRWRDEAQHAYNAYSGKNLGGSTTEVEFKKKYEFMVGEPDGAKHENYLEAIYRLAEEVNWSAYWVNDVLHFQSREDLFKSKARTRIRRDRRGVERVAFNWNHLHRLNSMTLSVRMEMWVAPLGTVVIFDEGGPAQGRWLVTNIRRSVFNELGEITLEKPIREKFEIANEPGSRQVEVRNSPGSPTNSSAATDAGGTIADVKRTMTPKQVIDKFVIPKAVAHGMLLGISVEQVVQRNHDHGGTPATSMHKGPPSLQWAIDMSVGTEHPTGKMDNLAFDLIASFHLPFLSDPFATNKDGYVAGNIVEDDHKGFHFQLIYRTDLGAAGGNHYNHVHFGLRKILPYHGPGPG